MKLCKKADAGGALLDITHIKYLHTSTYILICMTCYFQWCIDLIELKKQLQVHRMDL